MGEKNGYTERREMIDRSNSQKDIQGEKHHSVWLRIGNREGGGVT